MTHSVELLGVSKRFSPHGAPAVAALSLSVQPGEVVALLGPSGSGKTTLLRMVAGFVTPDSGSVRLGGRVVADDSGSVPPEQRGAGMVFQDHALFPHLTVWKNVAFGLNRETSGERHTRVQEALDMVGLAGLEQRFPHELSGGQQQRVALARALAPRPIVLLLDEPFASLDASLRAQLRDEVATIVRQSGATTLFVTHDQEEAMFMGDRVAVLREGRLEQIGSPEDVYHHPASRFVAEFMGKTDFLPGEIVRDGVSTELGLLPQRADLPVGTPVSVAFRPDDVRIAADPAGVARVAMRHFEGTAALYHVILPSGRSVHSLQDHTLVLPPGTPVTVWSEAGHELPCFHGQESVPAPPFPARS